MCTAISVEQRLTRPAPDAPAGRDGLDRAHGEWTTGSRFARAGGREGIEKHLKTAGLAVPEVA